MAAKKKPGKTSQPTRRAKLFCQTLIQDPERNQKRAAMTAGCAEKTAKVQACKWLATPQVKAYLATLEGKIERKSLMGAREVEEELDRLIRFNLRNYVNADGTPKDIHELTDEQAAAVKELGIIETQIGTSRSLKFFDKVQAIKLKMMRLGLLKQTLVIEDPYRKYLDEVERSRQKGTK